MTWSNRIELPKWYAEHPYVAPVVRMYNTLLNNDAGVCLTPKALLRTAFTLPEDLRFRFELDEGEDSPLPVPVACVPGASVFVGYSGGKDSLAAVLRLRKAKMNPIMFHVVGINKSYPNEVKCVRQAEERLGIQCHYVEVKLVGKHKYPDHPMKDQLILALMAAKGQVDGVARHTMGVEANNVLETSHVMYNWSDSCEMFEAFLPWLRRDPAYPFQWNWVLVEDDESYNIIAEQGPDLFGLTTGCVTPHRFQAMRKKQNEEKFGVELIPNRCGVCWKCCADLLNWSARGLYPMHAGLLKKCLTVCTDKVETIYGPGAGAGATPEQILDLVVNPRYVSNDKLKAAVL